jgi:disulfide bond formation protein DsbB
VKEALVTPAVSLRLNALGVFAISAVLIFAFADQLGLHELPCPLCILQRAGFVVAGFGLLLNLRFGPRPSHYAVVIIGALAGAAVSGRQILIHIVPDTGSYGSPLFGLHFTPGHSSSLR